LEDFRQLAENPISESKKHEKQVILERVHLLEKSVELFLVLMKPVLALLVGDHLERCLAFLDAAVLLYLLVVVVVVVVAEEQNEVAFEDESVLVLELELQGELARQAVAFQVAAVGRVVDRGEHQEEERLDELDRVRQVRRGPFQIPVYLLQLPGTPDFCGAWFDIGRSLGPFLNYG
jgi:hypothetical protein